MKKKYDDDDRIYTINLEYQRGDKDDYIEIPYCTSLYAMHEYAKQRDIPKDHIVALTPEAFDVLRENMEDNTDFVELLEGTFTDDDDKITYATENELTYIDDIISDMTHEMSIQILGLYKNLKYCTDSDSKKLRKALKDYIKAKGGKQFDISINLFRDIDTNKAFNKIIIKQKGEF